MINYLPPRIKSHQDVLRELYPEVFTQLPDIKTVTFQVTENCCLNCSYCYQVHNTVNDMNFEDIKPFIYNLLHDKFPGITTENTKAIVVEFIGGEPFMRIDLIRQITDYMFQIMFETNHPWIQYIRFSISSNGLLYFNPAVQDYLNIYGAFVSLGISLDGSKELHDACRVDLEGKGSYDRVIAAVHAFKKRFGDMPGIKMTFAPSNVGYMFDSYLSLLDEGYTQLVGNCVFEEGWEYEHATILYDQLKKIADYLIDNDLYNKIYVSFFEETFFNPMDEEDNQNWCGGVGDSMMAVDNKGKIYNCIRYMETSLQGEQPPIVIGDVEHGIGQLPEHQEAIEKTSNITRRSQSTDECFYCPVARGCAWCSGFNYQKTGTPNKRVTYICVMHKARALANVYFWNKLYKKLSIDKVFENHLPDEQSLLIISQEELNLLKSLEKEE